MYRHKTWHLHGALFSFAACLVIAVASLMQLVVFAATPGFTEYSLPVAVSGPTNIAQGPDGYLWFTEAQNNKIGRINPNTGVISEFDVPLTGPPSSYIQAPLAITKGPDNNMWYVNGYTNKVSKITTSGAITEYKPSNSFLLLDSIVTGPDNNLWFTAFSSNHIGAIDTNGNLVRQYSVTGNPEGISKGPDNNIWFAAQTGNSVGKVNVSTGAITMYNVGSSPYDTAPGPDGNVWFTTSGNKVGKINPSTGAIDLYNLPTSTYPINITPGPDGNMWFTVSYVGIGMINPSTSEIATYSRPDAQTGGAHGLVAGPDNNIWYTVYNNNSKIGKANIGLSVPVDVDDGTPDPGSNPGSDDSNDNNDDQSDDGSGQGQNDSNQGGQNGDDKDKITVIINQNGTTRATVETGIDLSKKNYEVPDKQVLYVDGVLGIVEVRNGASIKGTGKVGKLTVNKGGTLAPGHSPGCLTTGDLAVLGTYQVQIDGATACKGYDQIKTTGTVTLGGTLEISKLNKFTPKAGEIFIIIDNDGTDAISGTFQDLSEGTLILSQDTPYHITYKGGDGNDVALIVSAKNASLTAATDDSATSQVAKQSGAPKALLLLAVFGSLTVVLAAICTILYFKFHHKKPPTGGNSPDSTSPTQANPPSGIT